VWTGIVQCKKAPRRWPGRGEEMGRKEGRKEGVTNWHDGELCGIQERIDLRTF
jgi:hypothetical protein